MTIWEKKLKNLDLKITPSMDPTEKEFRERLDSMEMDDEVPTYIDPETLSERDFYYLLIKRHRTVSDIELLNHVWCSTSNRKSRCGYCR